MRVSSQGLWNTLVPSEELKKKTISGLTFPVGWEARHSLSDSFVLGCLSSSRRLCLSQLRLGLFTGSGTVDGIRFFEGSWTAPFLEMWASLHGFHQGRVSKQGQGAMPTVF